MRYRGYTESIEVLIDILDEQRKQTSLLEKLVGQMNNTQVIPVHKQNTHSNGRKHSGTRKDGE